MAAVAWLLQVHHRRQAFRLTGVVAGACLGLFLLLNLLTRGGFFLNVVSANLNPFSWRTVTSYAVDLYFHAGFLVIGCILFLIVERLGELTRSWPLVAPYFFGAMLVVITAGKAGSSVNYLFELVAALCLAAGAFIAWSGENYWIKAFLVFVLAVQISWLIDWSRQEHIPVVLGKVRDYREVSQMAELVREAQGPVLADEYMGLIPLSGRRLYLQPFEFKQLQATNRWRDDALIASIQREEFSAILLYQPRTWNAIIARWAPEVRNTIYAHYSLEKTLAETFIYLPKTGSSAP
jgi:hypothetical protein